MSKLNDALRIAFLKGYRVNNEGNVINAVGRMRVCQFRAKGNYRCLVFNIGIGEKKVYPVFVHKLQAFQKFGEEMFEPGIQVRHIDGDSLNNRPENIDIGTSSQNMMDRPPDARKSHGQHAANHLIAYDWREVETDYFDNNLGFKKLKNKYGMSTGTLSHHFNRIPEWKKKTQA